MRFPRVVVGLGMIEVDLGDRAFGDVGRQERLGVLDREPDVVRALADWRGGSRSGSPRATRRSRNDRGPGAPGRWQSVNRPLPQPRSSTIGAAAEDRRPVERAGLRQPLDGGLGPFAIRAGFAPGSPRRARTRRESLVILLLPGIVARTLNYCNAIRAISRATTEHEA